MLRQHILSFRYSQHVNRFLSEIMTIFISMYSDDKKLNWKQVKINNLKNNDNSTIYNKV